VALSYFRSVAVRISISSKEGESCCQYRTSGAVTYPYGANYDQLERNADGSRDETQTESGYQYHYPSGNVASLAYRATPRASASPTTTMAAGGQPQNRYSSNPTSSPAMLHMLPMMNSPMMRPRKNGRAVR
jgi:hypothetical protein